MKKLDKTVTNKNGTPRLVFSYTFEALPQVLFPGQSQSAKIASISVDYSRNIVNFYVTGIHGSPPTPEGSEPTSASFQNNIFIINGPKKVAMEADK